MRIEQPQLTEVILMKVINYLDAKPTQALPGVTMREVITVEDGAPNFCMRIFELEPGSSSHSHSHLFEHEVFVLSGRGVVQSENSETKIARGSVVFVPPNEHHCFVNEGNDPLRFICLIPT